MEPEQNGNGPPRAACDEFVAEHAPVFHEFFTATTWKEVERKMPSLTIWTEDGRFKISLSNKQTGMVAFWTLHSLENIWQELDRAIQSGNLEWKVSKMPFARK